MPTRTRSIRTSRAPKSNSRTSVSVNRDTLNRVLVLATDSLADNLECNAQEGVIREIFEEARSLRQFAQNHGIGKNYDTSVRRSALGFIFDECSWNATTYMNLDAI